MERILVHDLAAGISEYVNFMQVQTLCSSYTKPDIQNGGRLPDYVDHTNASDFLRRQASLTPIHSYDNSNDIAPSFVSPCLDVLKLTRLHRSFGPVMSRAYINMAKKVGQLQAMRALESANERLTKMEFRYSSTDEEIRDFAKAKSAFVMRQVAAIPDDEEAFQRVQSILVGYDIAFKDEVIKDKAKKDELRSLVNRASNEIWWRRTLRRRAALEIENVARDLAMVHKHGQAYCSNYSLQRRRQRNDDNQEMLKNTVAYDEDNVDNWFSLYELANKSISNPEIRRAEMFVRLKGFENIAKASDHVAMFYTPTCPSRFHSVSKGNVNQAWLDAGRPTTRDAHAYMTDMFAGFRKALDKAEIKVYGLRVVEPHADGCPHWHVLLFMAPQHRDIVTSIFRACAMQDTPDEPGADKYRFTSEPIDWSKGSAVGYVAKYLSKNIDGQHVGDDLATTLDGVSAAERVVTWARANGLRQFQFIGGPSVTVWRELRRVREEFKEDDALFKDLETGEWLVLENIRRAADSSDWEAFCLAMGGVFVRRDDQTIKPQYHVPKIMEKLIDEYGEEHIRTKSVETLYGDTTAARVVGLVFRDAFLATRTRNWKTENKELFLRGTKRIMTGVVDVFEALEREEEYIRMADEEYAQYQQYLHRLDEMNAFYVDEDKFADGLSGLAKAEPKAKAGGTGSGSSWTCVNNCH
ncbi:replication endonuclease [Photobacterium sp. DNB23_23_1]